MATVMRHPLELFQIFEENFRCQTPSVKTNMPKRTIKEIKSEYDDNKASMQLMFDSSLATNKITAQADIDIFKKLFENTRKRICLSYVTTEFKTKYVNELRELKGDSDFFTLLDRIFGKYSDKDKVRDAKRELHEITRHADDEERFELFYSRIEILAEKASAGCNILKKHYIDDTFDRSLTPTLRRYLLDQEMNDKSTEETAKYLDKMQKYKRKADIRVVSAQEILLQEKVNALTEQLQNNAAIATKTNDKIDNLERELAEIKRISARNQQRNSDNRQPTTERQTGYQPRRSQEQQNILQQMRQTTQQNPQQGPFPDNFEIGPNGYPFRCRKCGVLGHRAFNCKGTRLSCRICNQIGHIQFACPEKQSKN